MRLWLLPASLALLFFLSEEDDISARLCSKFIFEMSREKKVMHKFLLFL